MQVMGEKKKDATLGLKRLEKPGKVFILPMLNTLLLRRAAAHRRTPHQGHNLPILVKCL